MMQGGAIVNSERALSMASWARGINLNELSLYL